MTLVTADADRGWDDAVLAAGGSAFHTSAWARYVVAADPRAVPQCVRLESMPGGTLGHAVVFRARSRRPLLGALTRRCWLESAPIAAGAEALDAFLFQLERAARRAGDVVLDIGSFAAPGCGPALEKRGFATRQRIEFVSSLEGTSDGLWKAMDPPRQRNIRRGGRSGVVVEELPRETGVGILRRLQNASIERIVSRGGDVTPYAGDPAADPLHVLVDAGMARIIGARVGDEWVSAAALTRFNGRVFYLLAGHSPRGRELQSGSVLIWECLKWHRVVGDREFNLGGCPADAANPASLEHGVYRYKAGFGGTQVRCTSGTMALHPARLQLGRAISTVGEIGARRAS